MEQKAQDIAKESIKKHEGLVLKPYTCTAGKLSIGYGRNLEDNGISLQEAEMLLESDVNAVIPEVGRMFKAFDSMNPVRQSVIIELLFNMGMPTLSKFKKFISLAEQGKYLEASKELLNSKWAKQVGNRSKTLASRFEKGNL